MIQIAIIEDDRDMTEFLREIIDAAENMQCVNTYANAEDALVFIPQLPQPPDVVIVDIGLPGQNGIECVRQLKQKSSESTQFMMHTVFATQDKIFAALKAGATGYVDKEVSSKKVIMAIREMYNKGASISPAIAKKMIDFFQPGQEAYPDLSQLNPTENRALRLMAKGNTNREIAEVFGKDTNNIKQMIHRMYKKLHVRNRAGAINKLRGIDE